MHMLRGLKVSVKVLLVFSFIFLLGATEKAHAGDATTIIFKSGQVINLEDGYKQIADTFKGQSDKNRIIELSLKGDTVLLNISEIVVVCRDDCKTVKIQHQIDPGRQNDRGGDGGK